MFYLLKNDYHKSLTNIPIYIIWDRDRGSNTGEVVSKSLEMYGNSRDNEFDMNGILLLSYPCLESYELSNFIKQEYQKKYSTSDECKKTIGESLFNIHKINEQTLLLAVENMHRAMIDLNVQSYNTDNFKHTNIKIFNKQEEIYKNSKLIKSLSLISIMLIDLGIIFENNS